MPSIFVDYVQPLFLGVFGWWLAHWVASPVLALERVRREAREELYFHRHVSKDWKPEKIDRADESLRRVSARIEVLSMSRAARWYASMRGWNLQEARGAFHALTNVYANTRDGKMILVHEIERALGFPLSDTPERIRRLRKREDERED